MDTAFEHSSQVEIPAGESFRERKKGGSLSNMRSHGGNVPVLPQTKLCPYCPAKFTRTTHLNRHLRTHTNERLHHCDTCDAQFTRSDLLTRHKKSCNTLSGRPRRRACVSCVESKIKCDRQSPCSKCESRGIECNVSPSRTRKTSSLSFPLPISANHVAVDLSSGKAFGSVAAVPVLSADQTQPESMDSGNGSLKTLAEYSSTRRLTDVSRRDFSSPTLNEDGSVFDVLSSVKSDIDPETGTDEAAISSHLASAYSNDMFEPFFSNVFSSESPESIQDVSLWTGLDMHEELVEQSLTSLSLASGQYSSDLSETDLDNYLSLFFSFFLAQIPIVHVPTFKAAKKLPVLLRAMQACGALYVKTRKASDFIVQTLTSARQALVSDFAKESTDWFEQTQLILAVVLLQTIGLFHQHPEQRTSSSIYHGMLVMMIRHAGLIAKNASWEPGDLTKIPLETAWHAWAKNEMMKRAILWSYMHDCCHCIYLALPPSYQATEMVLNLPCEDSLWQASSSTEWFMILQTTSPYGSLHSRLTGISMSSTTAAIEQYRLLETPMLLNHFSHFVLVHSILRRLFVACVEGRPTASTETAEEANQDIHVAQFSLHNWLQNWMHSPEQPGIVAQSNEPPFIHNTLPFYWLGQVALLAYQDGLPPFEQNSTNNLNLETRFRLVKLWLNHIRTFLKSSDQAPTLLWDELMKLRLQSWQLEVESGNAEDHDGLLGFFPDT